VLLYKDYIKLRDFLYRKTGIYLDDKKYEQFKRKIEPYFIKEGFLNFRDFFHKIRFGNSQDVLQEIINLITVNETYFFRENHQFQTLVDYVLPDIIDNQKQKDTIRILCAPSSTGEEPYTIALTLIDEAQILENNDIEIVGIDIDSKVLGRAKEGIYNKRSVQFVPSYLLNNYFHFENDEYHIDSFLKKAINFKLVNVMDKNEMRRLGKFDIIFSRNMLIYFDEESRKEVGLTFYDILKPKGYVFLGHADKMSRISSLFNGVRFNKTLLYQKS
jgi:chemotaxis protein methyltransferase CheR